MTDLGEVLRFWFEEHGRDDWFTRNDGFDARIRERFTGLHERAAAGDLDHWQATGRGCVALCLLLDQVPRNLFRDDARAYATDARARAITRHAVDRGLDLEDGLDVHHRVFLYLPLEHSEDLSDQRRCVALVDERCGGEDYLQYAEKHLRVIEQFGRFPHRNAVLGRVSTEEEAAYLAEPGAGFG